MIARATLSQLIEWSVGIAQDAQPRELGSACDDRVVEREPPLVEHRQSGNRGYRFRERGDAEERVAFDGRPRNEIAASHRRRFHRAIAPDDTAAPANWPSVTSGAIVIFK